MSMLGAGQTVTVGVVADPGLPAAAASRLAERLPVVLGRRLRGDVRWRVETVCEPLMLDAQGRLPVIDVGQEYRAAHDWDLVVLLTDLPRRAGTQPILADYSTGQRIAMVSLPALGGGLLLGMRLRGLLVHILAHVCQNRVGRRPHAPRDTWFRRLDDRLAPARHVDPNEPGIDGRIALVGLRGRFRLLRGLVHDNRPWRLVPHLAGATAAAAATAAFGIFYSSIWTMADALPVWRLAVINAVAIAAMVIWLIAYNHLWDRPSAHRRPGQAVLYNAATVATITVGVTTMYAMLYALTLLASVAVIDTGYLRSQLGHPVGPAAYATLSWLASSMGIVAGALGTSLETEQAVRQATYSRREQERQARQARPSGRGTDDQKRPA